MASPNLTEVISFFETVFGVRPIGGDEVSVAFSFGETLVNVLHRDEAIGLFAPAETAPVNFGHHSMLTVQVDNVDAEAERLVSLGVKLNYGPLNQPWGIRVITFVDPTGQLWEMSQNLREGFPVG